jgi:hypothetical protein
MVTICIIHWLIRVIIVVSLCKVRRGMSWDIILPIGWAGRGRRPLAI